tara:strand:- start:633 stop:812 length:180 start_codon:yes stop_codon:yes gene_type:complete
MKEWAIKMGVMTAEQLEESREDFERRRKAEKVRRNLSSHSPLKLVPYVWTMNKVRRRSR